MSISDPIHVHHYFPNGRQYVLPINLNQAERYTADEFIFFLFTDDLDDKTSALLRALFRIEGVKDVTILNNVVGVVFSNKKLMKANQAQLPKIIAQALGFDRLHVVWHDQKTLSQKIKDLLYGRQDYKKLIGL